VKQSPLGIDSGDIFIVALDRCEELGLAVIAYTSFNDGTVESTVQRDAVRKALGHTNDVADEELRGYLTGTEKYAAEHRSGPAFSDRFIAQLRRIRVRFHAAWFICIVPKCTS